MMRAGARCLLAVFMAAAGAGPATAGETDLGLSYNIWFAPAGEDDPTPPPLTVQDQLRYCAIAEQWSRRIWEMTDGSHLLYRVAFYSGYDAAPAGYTVKWHRWDAEAGTALGAGWFNMYEGARKCDPVFEGADGDLGGFLTCPEPGQVCSSNALEDYRTARCTENGDQVLQTPEELSWTMAHELGHSDYHIQDEYATIAGATFPVCLGLPDNIGTDETSMMAWRGRNHWCSIDTHIDERVVMDANGDPILDINGEPVTRSGLFSIPEEGTWGAALENAWRWEQQPLAFSNNYETTPPFPGLPLTNPETGNPLSFCSFFAQGDGQPINDALVMLDKSGSMAFRNPLIEDGPTALRAAISGALSYYNSVREDRLAGIFAFDTDLTVLEEYALRDDIAQGFALPEPGGGTDLCMAINDGAAAIRAEAESFDHGLGQLILLSDGLPTAANCNSAEQVLQAAVDACDGGALGNGVAVNTIAFGDADRALMRQVAEVCDARTTALLVPASPFEIDGAIELVEDPLDIRTMVTRSGRFAQYQLELLNRTAPVAAPRDDLFIVPPGSQDLSVEWAGDGFVSTFFNDFETLNCRFTNLVFELLAPDGEIISKSASPVPGEGDYEAHTLAVVAPMAGAWRARVRPDTGFVCFPGSATSFDWGDYDPRVSVVASVRNARYTPDVMVAPTVAPRDGPVRITAAIDISPNARATGMTAIAVVTAEDRSAVVLPLSDDGTGGDDRAEDGIYTALFNANGSDRLPGGYSVAVTLDAQAGAAAAVMAGDSIATGAAAPLVSVPALRFSLQESFVLRDCATRGAEACPGAVAQPTDPSAIDACAIDIAPGETRQGLEVETRGLVLGTRNVTVSLGVGVRVRNIETLAYDAQTGIGRVRFDAIATPDAPGGPHHVQVGFAGRAVTSRDCGVTEATLYAAAFVCGPVSETLGAGLAQGRYDTAITVLNPNPGSEVGFKTSVARALPRQQPGAVTTLPTRRLAPGHSAVVGCDDIRRRLPAPMAQKLQSGYVTFRSVEPLVITTAYSARARDGGPPAVDIEPAATCACD